MMIEKFKSIKRVHLVLGVAILLTVPCYCVGVVMYWNNRLVDSDEKLTETVLSTLADDNKITATLTSPVLTSTQTLTATLTPTFTSTITYVLPDTETPIATSTYTASPSSTNMPPLDS